MAVCIRKISIQTYNYTPTDSIEYSQTVTNQDHHSENFPPSTPSPPTPHHLLPQIHHPPPISYLLAHNPPIQTPTSISPSSSSPRPLPSPPHPSPSEPNLTHHNKPPFTNPSLEHKSYPSQSSSTLYNFAVRPAISIRYIFSHRSTWDWLNTRCSSRWCDWLSLPYHARVVSDGRRLKHRRRLTKAVDYRHWVLSAGGKEVEGSLRCYIRTTVHFRWVRSMISFIHPSLYINLYTLDDSLLPRRKKTEKHHVRWYEYRSTWSDLLGTIFVGDE